MSSFRMLFTCVVVVLALPVSASAHSASAGTGGAGLPESPAIAEATCEDSGAWTCTRGARLTLAGEFLDGVRRVRFAGGRGSRDDRVARPRRAQAHRVEVIVPKGARSGRVTVLRADGARALTGKPLEVRVGPARQASPPPPPAAPAAPGGGVFPIAGPHTYGTGTNRFGGPRGHGGQDVFAACGTQLVALVDAKVQHVASDGRAGNYVVLQRRDGESFAYMHMQSAAEVAKGDLVRAGERVGKVGDSGRASGCHLHLEQWTAPGWYEGGKAIDPLPLLRSLDTER